MITAIINAFFKSLYVGILTLKTRMLSKTLIVIAIATPLGLHAEGTSNKKSLNNADKEIEIISVVGTKPNRYRTIPTNALTGLDLSFLELPRMVDIIPEQLLLDQKITELEEALRNVPGVSQSDGFGGSNNDFFIRGFRRNAVYTDGLRTATNARVNTANLESIRVIKGPASITYGQVEPGGLVDVITKKPLSTPRSYVEVRAGSWDNYSLHLDSSMLVGDKGAVRVNISSQDSGSFRDDFDIDRDVIALTGRYDFSENTRIDVSYEYENDFRDFDRGTITVPTANGRKIINNLLDIPRSRRFGEAFEEIDTQSEFSTLGLTHNFNNGWQLKLAGAWESATSDDLQARPRKELIFTADAPIENGLFTGSAVPKKYYEDGDQVYLARRTDGSRDRKTTATYLNAKLTGSFELAGFEHQLAIGADSRKVSSSRFFVANPTTNGIATELGGNGPLFNIEKPIFGQLSSTLSTEGATKRENKSEDFGVFVNDYIQLTDKVALLVGARLDISDVDGDGPADKVDEVSPQLAVSYAVDNNISAFASYSEAFSPNSTFSFDSEGNQSDSELFPPEDSNQIELGLKGQFFDDNLNISLATYKIEKENVLTYIGDLPELIKGQQSQGAELSILGQPIPGWTIMAGYAYTDAEILTQSNAGNRPQNVAKNNASLWTSYEFHQGQWQGLGAGTGLFYMGNRYGDNANSWELGSHTTVDLSLWYTMVPKQLGDSKIRFQLGAKNIFDEKYYSASGGNLRVSIGNPRSINASVAVTF
jgi:iron complex outermembrane receptor protein